MKLEPHDEELALKALTVSDTVLLQVLGEEAARESPGISPRDAEALAKLGEQRLKEIFLRSRDRLCSGSIRKMLLEADNQDERKALFAILDIILAHNGMLPAIYASVLLLRGFLEKWCPEPEEERI